MCLHARARGSPWHCACLRAGSIGPGASAACAALLVDARTRIAWLFGARVPYMLWLNQRPTTNETKHADAWLNFEIVSPWRGNGVMRYIAAAEVSTGEYFNPMIPEDLAAALRQ